MLLNLLLTRDGRPRSFQMSSIAGQHFDDLMYKASSFNKYQKTIDIYLHFDWLRNTYSVAKSLRIHFFNKFLNSFQKVHPALLLWLKTRLQQFQEMCVFESSCNSFLVSQLLVYYKHRKQLTSEIYWGQLKRTTFSNSSNGLTKYIQCKWGEKQVTT